MSSTMTLTELAFFEARGFTLDFPYYQCTGRMFVEDPSVWIGRFAFSDFESPTFLIESKEFDINENGCHRTIGAHFTLILSVNSKDEFCTEFDFTPEYTAKLGELAPKKPFTDLKKLVNFFVLHKRWF